MITLNQLIKRCESFADAHYFIESFSFGGTAEIDLDKASRFPLMHIVYVGAFYEEGTKVYQLEIYLLDASPEYIDKTEQQREVVSDCEQCLEDLIADLNLGQNVFELEYALRSAAVTPLEERTKNTLAGALLDISIEVPYESDACFAPIDGVSPLDGSITYARRGVLTVRTINGAVVVQSAQVLEVPNGNLTDMGNGIARLSFASTLDGLSDVTITSPLDHDALVYDDAAGQWINGQPKALDMPVYNGTGAVIAKGAVLKSVGAQGDKTSVGLFALGVDSPKYLVGLASNTLAIGGTGHARVYGELRAINTSAYPVGTILYATTTPGGFTTTAPFPEIPVATVIRQQQNTGRVMVRTWTPGGGGTGTTTNPTSLVVTNAAYTIPGYPGKLNMLSLPVQNLWTINQGSLTASVITSSSPNRISLVGGLTGRPIAGNITVAFTGLGVGSIKIQVFEVSGATYVTIAEINQKYALGSNNARLSFTYNTSASSALLAFSITPSPQMVTSALLQTVAISI